MYYLCCWLSSAPTSPPPHCSAEILFGKKKQNPVACVCVCACVWRHSPLKKNLSMPNTVYTSERQSTPLVFFSLSLFSFFFERYNEVFSTFFVFLSISLLPLCFFFTNRSERFGSPVTATTFLFKSASRREGLQKLLDVCPSFVRKKKIMRVSSPAGMCTCSILKQQQRVVVVRVGCANTALFLSPP